MTFRDMLVVMDAAASAPARAAFASDAAARLGAQLTGAFARGQIPEPFLPPDVVALLPSEEIQAIRDEHARKVDHLAEEARRVFEAAAGESGVVSDWRVVDDAKGLAACARRSDLMVLSSDTGQLATYDAASLVMAGGGPALIAPAGVHRASFGRVLVAWNGGAEAARALRSAWPIVAQADRVDVLIVSRHGPHDPDGQLQRHFERHGVKPNLILDDSDDAAAGEVLRRQIDAREPDLVIMGLYGHARLREMVLGGVSRALLDQPPAPLFVSH